ncbi:MAG: amidohydrolase, partial [Bacteroidetes bacterium]
MRNILLFIALLITESLLAQGGRQPLDIRMDFESYDPPSTLVVPEHPTTRAKYPFIDVHSHHWRMDTANLDKLIREMDSLNMGIIVNLSGRGGRTLKAMTENIAKQYPNRVAVFTNINLRSIDDPDWTEETVKQIEFDVANGACGLKIYKSQGMFNTDSSGNRIRINDPRIDPVWAKCGELGIPVIIHAADPRPFWQPLDSLNERWLELKLRPRRKREADDPAPWETIIA